MFKKNKTEYQVVDSNIIKKPCKAIVIANAEILNIDLNNKWNITEVKFPKSYSGSKIKKLIVTFEVEE